MYIKKFTLCAIIHTGLILLFLSCNNTENNKKKVENAGIEATTVSLESWALGPFVKEDDANPCLTPLSHTTFNCPVRGEVVHWEEKDVFNPAAVVKDGKVYLLYRAEDTVGKYNGTSRIGLAESTDGLTFTRRPEPVFYPDNDEMKKYEWEGGCEDPRIVVDESGKYFMTYTTYDGEIARLCVASSDDLLQWVKHGLAFENAYDEKYKDTWSKSGAIVTRLEGDQFVATKINGVYWMYWGDTDIFMATSENLIDWKPLEQANGELSVAFGPRKGMFDSRLVEPGPPAMLTDKGILLIYNGMNLSASDGGDKNLPEGTYTAGQVLMDKDDPTQLLERTEDNFLKPEKDYEITGQVGNVVFLEGLVYFKNKWLLYYGTADSKIAVASFEPGKVLSE